MSLSTPAQREKLHTRSITLEGFARADGNFDVDAHLTDVKTTAFSTDRGPLGPNAILHDLSARMTITPDLEIVDFEVAMDATPSVACETAPPNFKALIGLRIASGFVREAYNRVGGTIGCTHIRELLQQMATVAFQTLHQRRNILGAKGKPLLIDSCHGWRASGAMIRNRFPDYYQPDAARDSSGD